ncbi:hypothetical protein KRX52_11740 [Pseudomonas sp. MAP12]|uniref:Uncharacterized protein n=1 Tax=Geopseudomonas aromaticivorans TaxID=2849492 RepID=A0ABS6MXD6_9GAMM|nr:hypothetical protein [Pseudomonas aromaticivorans]MBV2133461.1 hypothetical protein [Pseudomonas aromaticivorans]
MKRTSLLLLTLSLTSSFAWAATGAPGNAPDSSDSAMTTTAGNHFAGNKVGGRAAAVRHTAANEQDDTRTIRRNQAGKFRYLHQVRHSH